MQKKVLDIAHRGASIHAPENTASSILKAIEKNADVIELDLQMTKDNHPVVIHDNKINRTSNGKGKVYKMTLEELKKYDFGMGVKEEKIISLQEALDLIGDKCKIILELKHTIKNNENIILNLINSSTNKENIWIHTKHKLIIKNVRALDSEIRLGRILFFSLSTQRSLKKILQFSKEYNVSFFSVQGNFANKRMFLKKFIEKLNEENIDTYVWTVNDFVSMYNFINLGVDGIISNHPGIIKK
jgi:glycerophosphoryl diester phosphodiesterase